MEDAAVMSDLERINAAFAALRDEGFVAEGPLGETSSSGWDEVATKTEGADEPRAVFWNDQSHEESFDDDGNLVELLPLQWSGDADAVVRALREQGFEVTAPASERDAIVVHPRGGAAGGGDGDEGESTYDIDVFNEVMDTPGWDVRWAGTLMEYFRSAGDGHELRVRADPDREVLMIDLAHEGQVVVEREIAFGAHFREALEAVVAVRDDVTSESFDEALEPVVAAAR